jgi:hypothetical protein
MFVKTERYVRARFFFTYNFVLILTIGNGLTHWSQFAVLDNNKDSVR